MSGPGKTTGKLTLPLRLRRKLWHRQRHCSLGVPSTVFSFPSLRFHYTIARNTELSHTVLARVTYLVLPARHGLCGADRAERIVVPEPTANAM